MLADALLKLLIAIKSNIVVDTGDGIRGIDAITLTEDGKGYIFVLEEDRRRMAKDTFLC